MSSELWKKFNEERESRKDPGDLADVFAELQKVLEDPGVRPQDGKWTSGDLEEESPGITDWIIDYLDDMEGRGKYADLLSDCSFLEDMVEDADDAYSTEGRKLQSYLSEGRLEEAQVCAKAVLDKDPADFYAAAMYIDGCLKQDRFEDAGRWIENVIGKSPCTGENEIVFRAAIRCYEKKPDTILAEKYRRGLREWEEKADLDTDSGNVDIYDMSEGSEENK